MPTDHQKPSTALFLFAHQDDEFGVFQQILNERLAGRQVLCAYLTDGASATVPASTRNEESLRVLGSLGIPPDGVIFAGEFLGIGDAKLPYHMLSVANWMQDTLLAYPGIDAIYFPAWEGGHHDHDALHAVAAHVSHQNGLGGSLRQFSLYNGKNCPGPFFSVLKPLPANGPSTKSVISMRNRLRFLRYCLAYPSQRVTWIGLLPFVLTHYLFKGLQELQAVSLQRLDERPHAGPLYYEKRKFFTWEQMQAELARFRP